jgi:cell shape-determining protein MreC
MAQRRGNLALSLRNNARSSRLLLAIAVLACVLVGLKVGAALAGRSSAVDRAVVHATAPLAVGAKRGGEGAGGLLQVFRLPSLLQENQQLREDNSVVISRVAELGGLRSENESLRKQLKLGLLDNCRPVHAAVIARPYDPWLESVVLGVGTERGVQPGCIVASEGALIGRVTETAAGFSRVRLISSPQFRIAGLTSPGKYEGVVRGVTSNELKLDYIRTGAKVEIDTKVYTRGSAKVDSAPGFEGSPKTPSGILIGRIIEKTTEQGFLRLVLEPAANLNRLSTVTVYVP